ncbi:MAG TPA: nucleotidyl transferase AbiEii/AbiGii toxin family protein [Candidatus Omnitrophota bacterium]|nr:nucleotidyl transferase AbiEii/AbiGii toxin family protein [Candidatus Omnitrophota bacterium]
MDFKRVLPLIVTDFDAAGVRYALIGGFALGLYGVSRSTVDIDFLAHKEDLDKIDRVMKKHGYNLEFRSENVSQFVSPVKLFGEIDFIHAFREISTSMLRRAVKKSAFGKELSLKVLTPEDIIGLKIQAFKNDASREFRDMADIDAVIKQYGPELDWTLLKDYFTLFGLQSRYAQLYEAYGKTKK